MTPVEIEVVFPLLTSVSFTCRRCGPLMGQLDIHKNYQQDCGEEYPGGLEAERRKIIPMDRKRLSPVQASHSDPSH